MKNNKKLIIILLLLTLTLTGCTKNLKGADGKTVENKETGQVLPSNIVCAPTDEDNLKIYRDTKKDLEEKYAKDLEKGDISKKEYNKKIDSLVDVDKMVKCKDFNITSGGYEGLWTNIFIKPLSWVIIKIGVIINNYGFAIIITTLLIRLIMYPLTLKTAKQSENMKKAQPELSKLEKKYANKNDQENMMKKSSEMMAIYKKYDINPMSGCLFSLIQIPLFFAFYESLSRIPALFEGDLIFKLGMSPIKGIGTGNWFYLILPVLVALTTFFSFKLNSGASMSKEQESQMKMMTYMMMIMIVFMSFSMSTSIIYYWITNSTFTIVQNLIVKRSK